MERTDYRARELLFAYKQTVLNAVRQVDSAIDAYAAQQDRLRHLADAVTAAKRAVTLATERFDRGLIDSLNVIDAERQEYPIEEQYVLAQQAAAEYLVTLYKSLGSGWEDYQIFPPIRRPLPAVAAALSRGLAILLLQQCTLDVRDGSFSTDQGCLRGVRFPPRSLL